MTAQLKATSGTTADVEITGDVVTIVLSVDETPLAYASSREVYDRVVVALTREQQDAFLVLLGPSYRSYDTNGEIVEHKA